MSEQQQGGQDAPLQEGEPGAPAEVDNADRQGEVRTYSEEYVKQLREEAAAHRVKLKQYEDRDKTEEQKTAERLAELEAQNNAYKLAQQRQQWAEEITKDSPVPVNALRGDTEDELREHFEQLRALISNTPQSQTIVRAGEERPPLALNGDGLEDALRRALGVH